VNFNFGAIAMWAIDFIRALNERNILFKILFRFIVGKYAYREFIGLINAFNKGGYYPFLDYSLEEMDYHKDKVTSKWWEL